jgi:hypothetical protein
MRLIASSLLLCLMTVTGAGGCARTPRATAAVPDIKALTGPWQGWLPALASGRPDRVTLVGGLVRFSGTGLWQGSLTPTASAGGRALRLDRDDRLYRGTLRLARDSILPTSGNLR